MIREHAQDFLVFSDNRWQFICSDFLEQLDSINTIELTFISSRLASNLTSKEAMKATSDEFSKTLFSHTAGPFLYHGNDIKLNNPIHSPVEEATKSRKTSLFPT